MLHCRRTHGWLNSFSLVLWRAFLQNGLRRQFTKVNSEIRNLTHFSKSQWWLDLTVLQTSESWGSWCLIYVLKNGAGHQSGLSMINKCKEAIQCSFTLSMPAFWALLFGREIFKFKVGARSHSRHWIKVPKMGLEKVTETWVWPFACQAAIWLLPESWVWDS